jgi:hypothetical protein
MVPERDFAFVVLTNSNGGSVLRKQLTPWALEHFLGLRETPRPTLALSDTHLDEYAGTLLWDALGLLSNPKRLIASLRR